MIYSPDVKSLVYGELQFISTAVAVKAPVVTMDSIIDDVSREIYELFISETVSVSSHVQGLEVMVETRN